VEKSPAHSSAATTLPPPTINMVAAATVARTECTRMVPTVHARQQANLKANRAPFCILMSMFGIVKKELMYNLHT
jgi:hypothetical protein